MKLLREYIREIILTESIDSKIGSQIDKLISMDGLIDINIRGKAIEINARRFDTWNHEIGEVFAMHGGNAGNCNNALLVGGSGWGDGTRAKEGIGPLLYDILMEATNFVGKSGLGPDYESVSDSAANVWNYYLNNRPDVEAKQRDITQKPRTTDVSDDCTENDGFRAVAKRFPGGAEAAYGVEPTYEKWDDGKDHPRNPEGAFTQEFIDYWFDPGNSLTKTYHKAGTPVLDRLRQELRLTPKAAQSINMPYTQDEMQKVWDSTWGKAYPKNHERIPWISTIWSRKSQGGFDNSLLKKLNPEANWEKFK